MVPTRDRRNLKIEVMCIKKPIAGKSPDPSFIVTLKDRSAAVECLFYLPKICDQDLYQSCYPASICRYNVSAKLPKRKRRS
jgi:hypothetical protein